MTTVFDNLYLSRHKLAFFVDITSGPTSSLSPISNYMAVGVGYIEAEFYSEGIDKNAYVAFLQAIPYNFYQIYVLVLALAIAVFERDLPIMYQTERIKRKEKSEYTEEENITDEEQLLEVDLVEKQSGVLLEPDSNKPQRAINAIIPLLTFLGVTIGGMIIDGYNISIEKNEEPNFVNIISNTRTLIALIWGVTSSNTITIFLLLIQRILTLNEMINVFVEGMRQTVSTVFILLLAWTLGNVCKSIHLNIFLAWSVGPWLPPGLIPALTMALGCFVSFASGTTFGTQAILFPLVIPVANSLAPGDDIILFATIGAVFSGADWGDSSSPFSDLTNLSAMVSGIPVTSHVKTQFPYVFLAGIVGLLFGFLLTGLKVYPFWVALIVGNFICILFLLIVGKKPGHYSKASDKVTGVEYLSIFEKIFKLRRQGFNEGSIYKDVKTYN